MLLNKQLISLQRWTNFFILKVIIFTTGYIIELFYSAEQCKKIWTFVSRRNQSDVIRRWLLHQFFNKSFIVWFSSNSHCSRLGVLFCVFHSWNIASKIADKMWRLSNAFFVGRSSHCDLTSAFAWYVMAGTRIPPLRGVSPDLLRVS